MALRQFPLRSLIVILVYAVLVSSAPSAITCPQATNYCSTLPTSATDLCTTPKPDTKAIGQWEHDDEMEYKLIDWYDKQHCSCDTNCELYGDCCHGNDNHKPSTAQCKRLDNGNFPITGAGMYTSNVPVYVISRCPPDWPNDDVKRRCEASVESDIIDNLKVTDEDNMLYANMHCAVCNNNTNPIYFNIEVGCSLHTEVTDNDMTDWSSLPCNQGQFPPNGTNPIHYCKDYVDTCSARWPSDDAESLCIRDECEQSLAVRYVYSSDTLTTYKNYACAVCNYDNTHANCSDDISLLVYPDLTIIRMGHHHNFYPLSILFDLNTNTRTSNTNSIIFHSGKPTLGQVATNVTDLKTCPSQHVYDPFARRCRALRCAKGYKHSDGRCVPKSGGDNLRQISDECTSLITLTQDEYIIYENDTLLEVLSGYTHDAGAYNLLNDDAGSALVCTEFTQNYTHHDTQTVQMFRYDPAQSYISLVGQILSIVALTIQLVVYILLPQLRNLPGWNLMCLSTSLLVSHLLFLIGTTRTEHEGVCVMFAMLLQYAFLAAFFWMSVMSFDLWITFSNKHASFRENNTKCFLRYSCYAWITPAIIMLISIICYASLDPLSPYNPAYAQGVCWITHKLALILYFAVPLAVLLSCNLLFYILTIINIRRVSETAKIVRRSDTDSSHLMVYIKLCVIMGLSWLFGFVATLAQVPAVWYIFLILNCLQGVFICLTFVCTKKVAKLLKEKFYRPERPSVYEDATKSTYLSKLRMSVSTDGANKVSNSPMLKRNTDK